MPVFTFLTLVVLNLSLAAFVQSYMWCGYKCPILGCRHKSLGTAQDPRFRDLYVHWFGDHRPAGFQVQYPCLEISCPLVLSNRNSHISHLRNSHKELHAKAVELKGSGNSILERYDKERMLWASCTIPSGKPATRPFALTPAHGDVAARDVQLNENGREPFPLILQDS